LPVASRQWEEERKEEGKGGEVPVGDQVPRKIGGKRKGRSLFGEGKRGKKKSSFPKAEKGEKGKKKTQSLSRESGERKEPREEQEVVGRRGNDELYRIFPSNPLKEKKEKKKGRIKVFWPGRRVRHKREEKERIHDVTGGKGLSREKKGDRLRGGK